MHCSLLAMVIILLHNERLFRLLLNQDALAATNAFNFIPLFIETVLIISQTKSENLFFTKNF